MARWFRIWEKKRGHRRTGSRTLGSAGEAMFFAWLFFFGVMSIVLLLASIVLETWPATSVFPEMTFTRDVCTIGETQIIERAVDQSDPPIMQYQPEVLVILQQEDKVFKQWTFYREEAWYYDQSYAIEQRDMFQPGLNYPCWFPSDDPQAVIVMRSTSYTFWIVLLVFSSFVIIGGLGLSYSLLLFGTSAERRSALAKQAQKIELIGDALPPAAYPSIPSESNLTNSPGVRLAYRLPLEVSPSWWLFAILCFSLLWNAMAAVFLIAAIDSQIQGQPDWLLTLITLPVLGIGGWSVYQLLKLVNQQARIGPTYLEISNHPLFPGKDYKLHFSQAGMMQINSLEVSLVCDEEATYLQGTDVRAEHVRVIEHQLRKLTNFEIKPGIPFEDEFSLQIPFGSMHSFKSDHNAIQWKLEVEFNTKFAGIFIRSFPIVIYPEAR